MGTLDAYRKNVYSQHGEDGVLQEVMRRLRVKEGFFVDVGAWDGKHFSNTYALLKRGWRGIGIECDEARCREMKITAAENENRLRVVQCCVTATGTSSLGAILTREAVENIDLMSIDIDSFDWWVWRNLNGFQPKVMVIEINSSIPVGVRYVQRPDVMLDESDISNARSSSFTAMLELGQEKGFDLVCHTGNMIFARRDLVRRLKLPPDEIAAPERLFDDTALLRKYVNRRNLLRMSRLKWRDLIGR